MDELIDGFRTETLDLVGQVAELLESIEGDYSQFQKLDQFGQIIDRVMGAAKTIAMAVPERRDQFTTIGTYCELCKQIGYKASQVGNNAHLFDVVVALLMDATEMLTEIVEHLEDPKAGNVKTYLTATFQDRLHWLVSQFPEGLRGTLGGGPARQSIDDLLKQLAK